MTRYLSIRPIQEPFDVGLDDQGRAQFSFNVLAEKRASATFAREIVALLEAAGVGTLGVSIFASSKALLPTDPKASFLTVAATGGTSPIGTHNDGPTAIRRPGARLIAHAATAEAAEVLACAAYNALAGVRNRDVEVSA